MGKKKQRNKNGRRKKVEIVNPLLAKRNGFIRLGNIMEMVFLYHNIPVRLFDKDEIFLGEYTNGNVLNQFDDCKIVNMNVNWNNKSIRIYIDVNEKKEPFKESDVLDEEVIIDESLNFRNESDRKDYIESIKKMYVLMANDCITTVIANFLYKSGEKVLYKQSSLEFDEEEDYVPVYDEEKRFDYITFDFDRRLVIFGNDYY